MKRLALAAIAVLALVMAGVAQADHLVFVENPDRDGFFNIHVRTHHVSPDYIIGEFNYKRALATPGLDAEAGWIDGDRRGYRCGYSFLVYRGWIVGRATYSYINTEPKDPQIIDRNMREGVRTYDGHFNEGDQSIDPMPGSCHEHLTTPTIPGPEAPHPPPTTFQHGPHAIEVRDFDADDSCANPSTWKINICGLNGGDVQTLASDVTFRLAQATDTRVEIIGFQDGVPVLQVLYDLMAPGVTVPNTDHAVTLHTGCDLVCEPEPEPLPSPDPSPEPEPEPEPTPIPGDINGDGRVNFEDLVILVENWTG